MSRAALALLLAVAALAGCGGGGDGKSAGGGSGSDSPSRSQGPAPPPGGAKGQSAEERVVRGWIAALDSPDYGKAAGYFARGAIVQQTEAIRLRTRAQAVAFNRSLPCKARVSEVRDEGRTVLVTFKLLDGPGAKCEPGNGGVASARVRCRIRDGRFVEWRQLPAPSDAPEGNTV